MQSPKQTLAKFKGVVEHWLSSLDEYTEEQFSRKPSTDEWSIGQVYFHLSDGTLGFHLVHIKRCLDGKEVVAAGEKTFPGRLSFLVNGFLPVRIKVPPSAAYTPKQPLNIAEAREHLEKLVAEMEAVEPEVTMGRADKKTAHPALGFLNGAEWYQLIEMHFRHHLRQKARLDKFLGVRG